MVYEKNFNYKRGRKSVKNPKIRLIFCDVDGTLLKKGEETVKNSVFHAIKEAVKSGIHFVIASGRPYYDLKSLFLPVSDLVTFISCDGALTVQNKKIINSYTIDEFIINRFNEFSGKKMYSKDSILNSPSSDIYKLAFCNTSPFEKQKIEIVAKNTGKLTKIYSDPSWIEFVSKDVNKGKAAYWLKKSLGISELETAAFGDNLNDIEMLRCASITYSSTDAIPEIKRMCKYNTKDIPSEILKIAQER